jgi:2-polyprenyl-3-methyl-5-hydroxy-6-metoxy-1,4-benzoquinol methylase
MENLLNFNIVHISINVFDKVYEDLISVLKGGLEDLDHTCTVSKNNFQPNSINILIGSTIFASRYKNLNIQLKGLPYIVYQLEHLHDDFGLLSEWPEYFELLQNANFIWDFAPASTNYLLEKGFKNVFLLPPGFHRSIEKFQPKKDQNIDVIFIGSPHPRRAKIIKELEAQGVKIKCFQNIFQGDRDKELADSKIVLNIHAWDQINSLETVRISYLLANKNFVLSEIGDHNPYGNGLIYAPYSDITYKCLNYLAQPKEHLDAIRLEGYLNIQKIDMSRNLSKIIEEIGYDNLSGLVYKIINNEDKYYSNARVDLFPFIPKEAKRILDIGCASGQTGRKIKERQDCTVHGVEINKKAALEASKYLDRVITSSVELALPTLPNNEYDCVLFLDVIEHLVSPEEVLLQIHGKISKDGHLVICVPNIGHWTIIQSLLEGKWDYQDEGILDRTHLRFFTLDSLVRLITNSGFKIITQGATKLKRDPPEKILKAIEIISDNSDRLKNQIQSYQYIMLCKKV